MIEVRREVCEVVCFVGSESSKGGNHTEQSIKIKLIKMLSCFNFLVAIFKRLVDDVKNLLVSVTKLAHCREDMNCFVWVALEEWSFLTFVYDLKRNNVEQIFISHEGPGPSHYQSACSHNIESVSKLDQIGRRQLLHDLSNQWLSFICEEGREYKYHSWNIRQAALREVDILQVPDHLLIVLFFGQLVLVGTEEDTKSVSGNNLVFWV